MSKLVKTTEEQIISAVTTAIKNNIADGTFIEAEIPAFKTEIPADRKNGDYSANAAFMLSKALRMPPRKIAEGILEKIDLNGTYFDKCEVAGPGFINFFLKPEFYADILLDIDASGDSYGRSDFGKGKKINVESFLFTVDNSSSNHSSWKALIFPSITLDVEPNTINLLLLIVLE